MIHTLHLLQLNLQTFLQYTWHTWQYTVLTWRNTHFTTWVLPVGCTNFMCNQIFRVWYMIYLTTFENTIQQFWGRQLVSCLCLQAAASSARLKGGSARLERSKSSRNSADKTTRWVEDRSTGITDKTTRLLVGILVLFLIAEVPQVKSVDIGTFELE